MTQEVVKSQPEKQLPIEAKPREQAEVEAYRQMDALDEQQMIDEQKGHVIDQYFYSFVVGGREIIGISWAGIKFTANKMASLGHPISVSELVIEEGQDSYKARAKAKDLATGEERWGVAEQPKVDEKGRRNMFAYPIAASKAQRNAIRSFVSEVVIQEGYREWKKRRTETREATKDTASEQQQAPRTTSTVESPVPQPASPSKESFSLPSEEAWQPKVPLTAEIRCIEGVKQYPLVEGLRSFGTINVAVDGSELSIIPEHHVLRECGPMGHLIYKVLEPMKTKHGYDYRVKLTNDKVVEWVGVRAAADSRIEEKQIQDLKSAATWAFKHAPRKEG